MGLPEATAETTTRALVGTAVVGRAAARGPDGVPPGAPAVARSVIDHVFISPEAAVLACRTLRVGASDHLAYAVTLRLP